MTPGRTVAGRPLDQSRGAVLATVIAAVGATAGVVLGRTLPEGEFVAAPVFLCGVLGATALGGLSFGLAATLLVAAALLLLVDDTLTIEDAEAVLPPLYVLGGGALVAILTHRLDQARRRANAAATRMRHLSEFEASLADLDDVAAAPDAMAALVAPCTGATSAALLPRNSTPDDEGPSPGQLWLPVRAGLGGEWTLELALDPPSDRDEARFLDDVTRQVGHTLERLALRETERRARTDEQLVSTAATFLSESLDARAITDALHSLLVPSWADAGAVTLLGDDEDDQIALDANAVEGNTLRVELRSRDRSIGWLTLGRTGRRFDDHDRAVVEQIASRAAQALDNALVYDAQSRTRSILERSLLPHALLPVENVAVAARYIAGTMGADVGGDFYDAVRRNDGSLVLIIGDVQGKGVEAATLTAVARHTLRGVALEGASPAEMLAHLNQALFYGQAEEEAVARPEHDHRFVTACVVIMEPTNCGFRTVAACGGHPPPLVVRADTSTEYLHGRGPLLGLLESPAFTEASTHLDEADTIVLYTDGVTELRHGGEWFDDVGLGRLLHNRRAAVDADAIAQLIQDTALMISADAARDDIAVLVASVRPTPRLRSGGG